MTAEGGAAATAARWGAVAVAAMGCVATACVVAVAAPANEPQAAFWWQPEPVSGLIPVPGVPSNGMYVASSPTGPQAEAAIRFDVEDPHASVRLTLHVSPQEQVGPASIAAYPATSHWQAGGPQPWSARPSYRANAKPALGVFSDNHTLMTLTFPARDAAAGIVLLPNPNAKNKAFTIAFTPPHAADISVRSSASSSPSATATATASHHPTPDRTHSSPSPSSRPTHPHRTHKPSKSPTPSTTPSASSSATPSPSTSPAPSSVTGSDHGTRTGLLIGVPIAAGVVLVLFWVRRSRSTRRRT